jgi:hypothetical protein
MKLEVKATSCEHILREATLPIAHEMAVESTGCASDVCAIDGAKDAAEVWKPLRVVAYFRRNRRVARG